jgi:hypothetical protein
MGAQVGGGLELIFLNQVPRFTIGTCLEGGLELLLVGIIYVHLQLDGI